MIIRDKLIDDKSRYHETTENVFSGYLVLVDILANIGSRVPPRQVWGLPHYGAPNARGLFPWVSYLLRALLPNAL